MALRRIFRLFYCFDVVIECMSNVHPIVEFVHNGLGIVLNLEDIAKNFQDIIFRK